MKKTLFILSLAAISCCAFAQDIGPDRVERESGKQATAKEGDKGRPNFSVFGRYGSEWGDGVQIHGPSVLIGFSPTSNGMFATNAIYRYDTILTMPGHMFGDFVQVGMQLSPDSFPITFHGSYMYHKIRGGEQFNGVGLTASKEFEAPRFLFADGYTLELGVTGMQEHFTGVRVDNNGMAWDASATLRDRNSERGITMVLDYVFKSDVEGSSHWFLMSHLPLTDKLGARLVVGQNNMFGAELSFRFK